VESKMGILKGSVVYHTDVACANYVGTDGTTRAALYWCTNTWYAGAYWCFDEEEKEVKEEGSMEEQRRKKEKGRWNKKKKEKEEKWSDTWDAAIALKGSNSITMAKRQWYCSEELVPLQHSDVFLFHVVEVRSRSDGLMIKMHDGRHLRCVHNDPQAGNLLYYAPRPAIVLKMEDGSDILLPILVFKTIDSDRPDDQPCYEAEEFDMLRNMMIASVEERYRDAGMIK
ncbi:hypothetical protein BHE74_00014305, partial [Ensete ventricosum]